MNILRRNRTTDPGIPEQSRLSDTKIGAIVLQETAPESEAAKLVRTRSLAPQLRQGNDVPSLIPTRTFKDGRVYFGADETEGGRSFYPNAGTYMIVSQKAGDKVVVFTALPDLNSFSGRNKPVYSRRIILHPLDDSPEVGNEESFWETPIVDISDPKAQVDFVKFATQGVNNGSPFTPEQTVILDQLSLHEREEFEFISTVIGLIDKDKG